MRWWHFVLFAVIGGVIGNMAYDVLKSNFRPNGG